MDTGHFFDFVIRRIKRKVCDLISFCDFLHNKISPKSVLIVELNECHAELLPSYSYYFRKLGFNVEIVAAPKYKGFLPELFANKIYHFTVTGAKNIFKLNKINRYKFIIFTSYVLYHKSPDKKRKISKVFEHFKMNKTLKVKTGIVVHDLGDIDNNLEGCLGIIVLSKILSENTGEDLSAINPCYFKDNAPKDKNKITTFVTVGRLEDKRKNSRLLFDTVKKLAKSGVNNFRIMAVGDNTKDNIPSDLRQFILPLGRLDFNSLYKVLEAADFFLPLLDPDFNEHLRYIQSGTSGSFQLIRGFLLPPLVHNFFGEKYGFNYDNSILYKNNEDFLDALKTAINMENAEYLTMQNNILSNRTEIQDNSICALMKLLNKHH